jgi:hypothetical protein
MASTVRALKPPSAVEDKLLSVNGHLDGLLDLINQLGDRLHSVIHEGPEKSAAPSTQTHSMNDNPETMKLCDKLGKIEGRIIFGAGKLQRMLSELAL